MNKLAAKEPSMDEILSSIRQIIADDDSLAEKPKAAAPVETSSAEDDDLPSFDAFLADEDDVGLINDGPEAVDEDEPLELMSDQIVVPDDEGDPEPMDEPVDFSENLVLADDVSFDEEEPIEEPMPEMVEPVAQSLPDPELSDDIAQQLLEPAAEAAASHAFARLGTIAIGNQAITLEAMIKEMLRPMLKQWLDENLPSVVEKLVEKEIERVTRGGRS